MRRLFSILCMVVGGVLSLSVLYWIYAQFDPDVPVAFVVVCELSSLMLAAIAFWLGWILSRPRQFRGFPVLPAAPDSPSECGEDCQL